MPQERSLTESGAAAVQPSPRFSRWIESRQVARLSAVTATSTAQFSYRASLPIRSSQHLAAASLQTSESKDTRNLLVWHAPFGSV
jgi:hypothetical protein